MEKNDKTGKTSYDELENSAQGLLRRLNNRYDVTRVEAEKSAMKNLDGIEETDANDPDVVAYTVTTETLAAKPKKKKKRGRPEDTGEISEEELQSLFDKYLGGESTSSEESGYDSIHQKILDAEQRSGVDSTPKTDVEKNIDEAEKYIDAITTGDFPAQKDEPASNETSDILSADTGDYPLVEDESEDILAYEPKVSEEAAEPEKQEKAEESAETSETEIPSDTAMMKAFGLNPQKEASKDIGSLFDEFSLAGTEDFQSTEIGRAHV